jgi:hypothetical protein
VPLTIEVIDNHDAAGNHYRAIRLDGDSAWLELCAAEYVRLRTECAAPLEPIQLEGIEVLDIRGLSARLQEATIPARRQTNFDVVRSDFGELLAHVITSEEFGTRFGYEPIRDRETVQQPARGIDVVGIEVGDGLTLVLGEAKVSNDANSPPGVVDAAADSLRNQHRGHLQNPRLTADKVFNQSRRVLDLEVRNLLFIAALLLEREDWINLQIVSYCMLVRPLALYSDTDFGTFRTAPNDFNPASIRFIIVCVPEAIDTMIDSWHAAVRGAGLPA